MFESIETYGVLMLVLVVVCMICYAVMGAVRKELFDGEFLKKKEDPEIAKLNKRIDDLRTWISRLGDGLGHTGYPTILDWTIHPTSADKKLDMLLNYLGLEYQQQSSEKFPKIVKKGRKPIK